MLYKNISDKQKYVVSSMSKTLVLPGDFINMSDSDCRHSGSNFRFFKRVGVSRPIEKVEAKVKVDKSTPVVEEKKIEKPIVEKKIETKKTEAPVVNKVVEPIAEKTSKSSDATIEVDKSN